MESPFAKGFKLFANQLIILYFFYMRLTHKKAKGGVFISCAPAPVLSFFLSVCHGRVSF